MRAGTQTLIQALQALPWTNSDDEDHPNDPGSPGSESDDDRPNSSPPFHVFLNNILSCHCSSAFVFFYPRHSSTPRTLS